MAAGTESLPATDASSTIHTPSGNSPASSAPTSIARRVLPTPPGPVEGDEALGAHDLGHLTHECFAPDDRAEQVRQVAGRPVAAAQHGEVGREAVGQQLVHRHRTAHAAEPVLTHRLQRDAVAHES